MLKNRVKERDADQYQSVNEAIIDLKNDRIDALLIDHRVYADYYLLNRRRADEYDTIPSGFRVNPLRPADKSLEALNQAPSRNSIKGYLPTKLARNGLVVPTPEVKGQE